MENREIARILRETAQLLEIDGAIIGRYRSYEKAAELINSLTESVAELAQEPKKLTELPGIGAGLAEHIQEIVKTGDYSLRKKLLKKYPDDDSGLCFRCILWARRKSPCYGVCSKPAPSTTSKNSRASKSYATFPASAKKRKRTF